MVRGAVSGAARSGAACNGAALSVAPARSVKYAFSLFVEFSDNLSYKRRAPTASSHRIESACSGVAARSVGRLSESVSAIEDG